MISDSITNASASAAPSARDMGKKKRVINNVFFGINSHSFLSNSIPFCWVSYCIWGLAADEQGGEIETEQAWSPP